MTRSETSNGAASLMSHHCQSSDSCKPNRRSWLHTCSVDVAGSLTSTSTSTSGPRSTGVTLWCSRWIRRSRRTTATYITKVSHGVAAWTSCSRVASQGRSQEAHVRLSALLGSIHLHWTHLKVRGGHDR